MIYNDFHNKKLSSLGLGTMRLPTLSNDGEIDEVKTAEMIDYALKNGINYFDTAYGYHNGNSERVVGKILKRYPRSSYYLATKFPGYDVSRMEHVSETFEDQLSKTGADYFDFYLYHCVCEGNIEYYLNDDKYHLHSYLLEQKVAGRIKHIGFSVHASLETTKMFLEKYGKDIDFCQVQLNWLDWSYQDAKAKVELLNKYNIAIWVMEPLRGGRLANLDKDDIRILNELRPNESTVGWSFRYLQSLPGVTVVLSGMSNTEQLKQNIKIFETKQPLNDSEIETLYSIAKRMTHGVPCTECRYCTSYCPNNIDIPSLINIYNDQKFNHNGNIDPNALDNYASGPLPSDCIGCRSCEAVCPQQIKISKVLCDFAEKTAK